MNDSLLPGRIQVKADILENNLYATLSKAMDRSEGRLVIERKQWPDAVIVKALGQLLPRLNINDKSIVYKLGSALKAFSAGQEVKPIACTLYDRSVLADSTRTVTATVSAPTVTIVFAGVPVTPGIDGGIEAYYFNHEDYPGKLLENQTIDFREINKFPVINQGEDMLLVRHEVKGKSGLTFDGEEISPEHVAPFTLTLHEGVTRIEQYGSDGRPKGYLVRAARTGVIIFNKEKRIPDLDVRDEIDIKQLDYSVGNIGTEYISPISVKVGLVRNGFTVRVNGRVEIDTLDGGLIFTNAEAVVKTILSKSSVSAKEDIEVRTANHSRLVSETGKIRIENELIDSSLEAPRVRFNSTRGLFTNTDVTCEDLFVKNVYFCGESEIHLGRSLFLKREALQDEKTAVEEGRQASLKEEKTVQAKLLEDLKSLSVRIKDDPESLDDFKRLVQMFQKQDFDTMGLLLDSLQRTVNFKVIRLLRNRFDALKQHRSESRSALERLTEIEEEFAGINERLNAMKFYITGFVRPSARVRIYCSIIRKGVKEQPVMVLESDTRGDKRINLSASFSLEHGFQVS